MLLWVIWLDSSKREIEGGMNFQILLYLAFRSDPFQSILSGTRELLIVDLTGDPEWVWLVLEGPTQSKTRLSSKIEALALP